MDFFKKNVKKITNLSYAIGCLCLYLVAAIIIIHSLYSLFYELTKDNFLVTNLFDEIGLMVFAIAIIDIAKYLFFEEVFRTQEERNLKEMRRTLTKIVSIISTALFVKGLIMTMEAAKVGLDKVIYPLMVIISPVFLIIGLAIYHKLSFEAEK